MRARRWDRLINFRSRGRVEVRASTFRRTFRRRFLSSLSPAFPPSFSSFYTHHQRPLTCILLLSRGDTCPSRFYETHRFRNPARPAPSNAATRVRHVVVKGNVTTDKLWTNRGGHYRAGYDKAGLLCACQQPAGTLPAGWEKKCLVNLYSYGKVSFHWKLWLEKSFVIEITLSTFVVLLMYLYQNNGWYM